MTFGELNEIRRNKGREATVWVHVGEGLALLARVPVAR